MRLDQQFVGCKMIVRGWLWRCAVLFSMLPMMLAAGPGSKLKLIASGTDAQQAVSEIEALLKRKFDED